jgi:maltose alpha-D-glucosyltransferase/alpha-amylase
MTIEAMATATQVAVEDVAVATTAATSDLAAHNASGFRPDTAEPASHSEGAASDRVWFRDAVFYEVLVSTFRDGNGDGIGDLIGLAEKLDDLQWLGVDCLWLPPFYPSPMKDGGYDVADFCDVHPDVGTIAEFTHLVNAAHARGIRVIIDFVMNHTSDRHPWFQASRLDPNGPFGDFYVWSDTNTGYPKAPVIFPDVETSNWTFDAVRKQYFWHRFYSHQPDLNYDNPAVQQAILNALRFWLDFDIDGFRLDAVPYLFQSEDSDCAHLPQTHAFLKRVRATVDEVKPGCVLLAEANGFPGDVRQYFGDGDECNMTFNFPLMPRLFMALRRQSRQPIVDILAETGALPSGCQWATFLRNHDELTLEMVTADEREYMLAEYAEDPRMKANIGIRRRLAPLLRGDRRQLEILTALLVSLPGTPVLYYGDEIGMGDNIWLGDRDGVRTPMQWSPDRNAGFSLAEPRRLIRQPVMDAVFGHQSVNVEAQQRNTSSLLNWTRMVLATRKLHPALGLGAYHDIAGNNEKIFTFVRTHDDDIVLCVNNLSAHLQGTELDLGRWRGHRLVELFGGYEFPRITKKPTHVTLAGYGFLWLRLIPTPF